MARREELLDQVTDHVLEHGLIGLTLRPLAAAIGTSDRMLIYHFGSRDGLVSAVVALNVQLILLYTRIVIKERFTPRELTGMALALVGVLLLRVLG